jgi:hypothetical protein
MSLAASVVAALILSTASFVETFSAMTHSSYLKGVSVEHCASDALSRWPMSLRPELIAYM